MSSRSNNSKNRTEKTLKQFVVHNKRSSYDVYIGRPSKWGNPFKIGRDGSRAMVIAKYENWVSEQDELIEKVKKELPGKVLACWCAPKDCHGDVLSALANDPSYDPKTEPRFQLD
eukprot:gb/GECH01013989.1/.p1 GENE.gb/GECH01013989.1/~~gb/GECH01013989.1/.p1  ORF type:complete len:115 (+),score=22.54 gb/GECH01013989.1/:1-345(+)